MQEASRPFSVTPPPRGAGRRPLRRALCAAALLAVALGALAPPAAAKRSTKVLGCWGDADKGDSAELKLHFAGNGAMVQYDERKPEQSKRSFGAWEMEQESNFLTIYWPNGSITRYTIKRIGPILHFSGVNGSRNFTLREVAPDKCWSPEA